MKDSKTNQDSVARLLEELHRGDSRRGWEEFLRIYASSIARVVSYCERDPEDRADAFVFACEQLHREDCRRLRKFKIAGPASFTTWLHAVVRNLCRDWRRRRFGRSSVQQSCGQLSSHIFHSRSTIDMLVSDAFTEVTEDLADPSPDPFLLLEAKEQGNALARALPLLSAEQRLALLLRVEQGLTLQEIATILELKNAQAADRLVRDAIQMLRSAMDVPAPLHGKTKVASV